MSPENDESWVTKSSAVVEYELLQEMMAHLGAYDTLILHILGSSGMREYESHPLWPKHLELKAFNTRATALLEELREVFH